MKYKKWSLEEKLTILASSEEIGTVETFRKYGVSTGTFYSWKKKFEHKGEEGLKVTYDIRSKWEHKIILLDKFVSFQSFLEKMQALF